MATTSYDYVDEFTKQLARKRRLAQLLQDQSLSPMQMPNNAPASFLAPLGKIAEAYFGNQQAQQANAEGTAHEAEVAQKQNDLLYQAKQAREGLPVREDADAAARAYYDQLQPPPSAPTTRPSTDTGSPLLPPSQQPQNPMAQLLMGQNGPSLGADLAQQGPPMVPQLGEIGQQAAAAPSPMIPPPPQFNLGGEPLKRLAELQAIAQADVRNEQPVPPQFAQDQAQIPPMPPQGPTPAPSLAGPPTPGAVPPPDTPPPLISQQPQQTLQAPGPQKPLMLPAQPGKMPDTFDMLDLASKMPPGQLRNQMMIEAYKATLTEPDRVQAQKDRQDTLRAHYADINAQRQIAEQQKHEYFMSRVQNEKDRVAEINRHNKESEDIRRGQAGAVAAGGGGQGKAPSGYRWSNEQQGQLEPIPGGPSDPKTIADKKNAIQITGGRESVYATRVMQAANQASKDIGNIMKLPVEAQTTGIFGGRHQGSGLFDATKEVLAQKMTPQEAQAYNVMATGLQRTLAAVETSGLAQGIQEFSKSIDVVAKEGDTNLTKMHKLAQSRQILEAGLDPILANPRISEPEKELVRKTLEVVKQTVPFTHSDLIELTAKQAINPDTTMKELLKKTGEKVPEFKTEAEAAAAEAAGTLKKGSRVKIGGVVGTWE